MERSYLSMRVEENRISLALQMNSAVKLPPTCIRFVFISFYKRGVEPLNIACLWQDFEWKFSFCPN
jgi:hypothetical protein